MTIQRQPVDSSGLDHEAADTAVFTRHELLPAFLILEIDSGQLLLWGAHCPSGRDCPILAFSPLLLVTGCLESSKDSPDNESFSYMSFHPCSQPRPAEGFLARNGVFQTVLEFSRQFWNFCHNLLLLQSFSCHSWKFGAEASLLWAPCLAGGKWMGPCQPSVPPLLSWQATWGLLRWLPTHLLVFLFLCLLCVLLWHLQKIPTSWIAKDDPGIFDFSRI